MDDDFEVLLRIEVQMKDDAEASAQRRRDEPRACRRADQSELGQVEFDGARGRALPNHDVELIVLHRGVEDFFNLRLEAVYLVDEENFTLLQVREHRREVAATLDGGRAHALERRVHLGRDDLRECRLAQSRRAEEEDVVERLAPRLRRAEEYLEVGRNLRLPDVLFEAARAQGGLDQLVVLRRRA